MSDLINFENVKVCKRDPNYYSKKYGDSVISFIETEYPNKGIYFCQKHLDIPTRIINKIVKRLGLQKLESAIVEDRKILISRGHELAKFNMSTQLKKYNEYIPFFNKRSSYALGLLWADGYLQHSKTKVKFLKMDVVAEDYKFFKSSLMELGNVTDYNRIRPNRKPQISCNICNMGMNNWLYVNSFKDKSISSPSFILQSLSPSDYADFLRGWIDGDGCFYINKKNHNYQFSLCGSYEQDWSFIFEIFNELDIHYKLTKREIKKTNKLHKHSVIRITSIKDISKLVDYIYYDGVECFLPRKYEKAMLIRNLKRDDPRKKVVSYS